MGNGGNVLEKGRGCVKVRGQGEQDVFEEYKKFIVVGVQSLYGKK